MSGKSNRRKDGAGLRYTAFEHPGSLTTTHYDFTSGSLEGVIAERLLARTPRAKKPVTIRHFSWEEPK